MWYPSKLPLLVIGQCHVTPFCYSSSSHRTVSYDILLFYNLSSHRSVSYDILLRYTSSSDDRTISWDLLLCYTSLSHRSLSFDIFLCYASSSQNCIMWPDRHLNMSEWLERLFGVKGSSLLWFPSYLTDQSQSLHLYESQRPLTSLHMAYHKVLS